MKKTNLSKLLLIAVLAICIACGMIACKDPQKYTVTFNSDGGSFVESITVQSGKTIEEPAKPTKTGYTFHKWVKEDGSDFGFGTEIIESNITLTAKWNINVYKVTFNTDGGTSISEQSVNHNGTVNKPANPTKQDYIFVRWYEDANFTIKFDFEKGILKDTTLYALFVKDLDRVFTVKFEGSEAPLADQQTNAGGVLVNLPIATKEGAVFAGWWMSDFESATKLTCQYTNQVLTEHKIFYAVWESDSVTVSVNSSEISWSSKGITANYTLKITPPDGSDGVMRTETGLKYAYDFTTKESGEYKIEVTVNGETTAAYYNNKALSKVCLFDVNDFELQFNSVPNAQKYLITVDCGNKEHNHVQSHSPYDNGNSTVYDFELCDMQKNGITFTVQAVASGYITSTSKPFNFERSLNEVNNIRVDNATEEFVWDKVDNADYYMLQVGYGEPKPYYTERSDSFKEYDAGEIKIKIYAVGHGYNPSDPIEYTYNKTRLATPRLDSIKVEGDVLSWNSVEGAVKYIVKIGSQEHEITTNEFTLDSTDQTTVQISIQAIGDIPAKNSLPTDIKTFSATLEGLVSYKNGVVSWPTIFGATKYTVSIEDGETYDIIDGSTSQHVTFAKDGKQDITVCFYDKNGTPSGWEKYEVTVYAVTLEYNFEGYESYDVLYRVVGDNLLLPASNEIEIPGYNFLHWSATSGGGAYLAPTLTTGQDLTLYARWSPKQYLISFNYTGGTMEDVSAVPVPFGQHFELPTATCTDVSKIFDGWYTSPNRGGVQITDYEGYSKNVWTSYSNMTLYAGWIDIFTFSLITNGTEYSVMQGQGIKYLTSVTVPTHYDGKPITLVDSSAFKDCNNLVTINIPDTVKNIDMSRGGNQTGSAFQNCSNLTAVNIYETPGKHEIFYKSVNGVLFHYNRITNFVELVYYPYGKTGAYTIPYGVEVIPTNTFKSYSKLNEINISASVTQIDLDAFRGCVNLTRVKFLPMPENPKDEIGFVREEGTDVTGEVGLTFGGGIFMGCTGLVTITLPSRLISFNVSAFTDCSNLTHINIEGTGGTYTSNDGLLCNKTGDTIVGCPAGRSGVLTIPVGVSVIGESAFENCKKITGLIVPGYVTDIEKNAFKGCTGLQSIQFNGVKNDPALHIREMAFYECKSATNPITEITLPANLKYLGRSAFGEISTLTRVIVNCTNQTGSVTFEKNAFGKDSATNPTTSISYLYLGAEIYFDDIGGIFGSKLATVEIHTNNLNYTASEGVVYNRDVTKILYYPSAKIGPYKTPDTVTEIGDKVFYEKNGLSKITITSSVIKIGEEAFSWCTELKEVVFENDAGNALEIGKLAFYLCRSITQLDLPDRLTIIGDMAFQFCYGLTNVVIPEGVIEIGEKAFQHCRGLVTISIPKTVTLMKTTTTGSGSSAVTTMEILGGCTALKTISVHAENPNYATVDGILYGKTAGVITDLYMSPLFNKGKDDQGTIVIPATLTKVWASAFKENAGVKKIDFSNITGTVEFGKEVFYKCMALEELILPNGMTTIGTNMFYQCTALKEITIPNTVHTIEYNSFYYCTSLQTLTFATGNDTNLLTIRGRYVTQTGQSDGVFFNCPMLTSISFPARLKEIGTHTFKNSAITAVDFTKTTNSFTTIGNNAFTYTRLASVAIPKSVTSLGTNVFEYCASLATASIHEDSPLTTLPNNTFYQCTKLQKFSVPKNIQTIGNNVFQYAGLSQGVSFTLDSALTSVGTSAFAYSALQSIELPKNIQKIGTSTTAAASFSNCLSLGSITFAEGSNSLNLVGVNAFEKTAISTFTFPESSTEIVLGATIFTGCVNLTTLNISTKVLQNIQTALGGTPNLKTVKIATDNGSYFVGGIGLPAITSNIDLEGNYKDILFLYKPVNEKDDKGNIEVTILPGTVSIAENAFKNQTYITKINIPASVLRIGAYAFQNCLNLREVNFATGSSLQSIGNAAFARCTSLTTINLDVLTHIVTPASSPYSVFGEHMFRECTSLETISLPPNITTIAQYTFAGCTKLKTVNFPTGSGLTTMANYVFSNCTSLTSITLPTTLKITAINTATNMFMNCGLTSITIPEGMTAIPNNMLDGCKSLETVNLHSGLVLIGSSAFANCKQLQSITIPSSVTAINSSTFSGCSKLSSVSIPNIDQKLTTLASSAFKDCTSLTSFVIPTSVSSTLTGSLFEGCINLTSVTIPSGARQLGSAMFKGCTSLKTISLPDEITYMNTSTFMNSGLESITIPSSVQHIGSSNNTAPGTTTIVSLFEGCKNLTKVVLPANLISIGGQVFKDCTSLEELTYTGYTGGENMALPSTVTTVCERAFSNTGLTSITLNYLSTRGTLMFADSPLLLEAKLVGSWAGSNSFIPYYMFQNCENLQTVTIPNGISSIGSRVFENCTSLRLVDFTGVTTMTGINEYAFKNCTSLQSINLPASLTSISTEAFAGSGLLYMNIPGRVNSISRGAFGGCTALEEFLVDPANSTFKSENGILFNKLTDALVCYPAGKPGLIEITESMLENYTAGAFHGLKGVEHIIIPEGVTSLPAYAFYGFTSLKTVSLPESLTEIGNYAFAYCTSLTSIVIPENVQIVRNTNDGYAAMKGLFEGCTLLSSVTLPSKLSALGSYMFSGCTSLKSINLPEGIDHLNTYTFQNSGLESIVIPSTVQHLTGSFSSTPATSSTTTYLFSGCNNLTSVLLPEGLLTIGSYTFEGCTSLESINFPKTLTLLGEYSFKDSGLTNVTVRAEMTDWTSAFRDCTSLVSATVNGEKIASYGFYGCTGLRNIVFNESVTTIDSFAFVGCMFESFTIPKTVRFIQSGAFQNCTAVKDLFIPAKTYISNSVFSGWTVEQTVYVEESIYIIMNYWTLAPNTNLINGSSWYTNCDAVFVFDHNPDSEIED